MQFVVGIFVFYVIADIVLHWLGGGDVDRGFLVLWHLMETGLLLWAGYFVYSKRYPIARWYYFTFHPHPAEPAVRSLLAQGKVLDGTALAAVLGEPRSGDPIFRAVRAQQAKQLIGEMQAMTQRQMRELEARAKANYEVAAVQQTQAALARAALALDQANAYLQASRRS
jgi:hypothetical protein